MAGAAALEDRIDRAVSAHTQFLQDGRARNLLGAVRNIPKSDRTALIKFLESL